MTHPRLQPDEQLGGRRVLLQSFYNLDVQRWGHGYGLGT